MSDEDKKEIVLSPEGEHLAREFAGHFQNIYTRLGDAEGRVGRIERFLSIRLNTKLLAVPGSDVSDQAELLKGIREGVEIETVLLDVGQRLHDLEYFCFAPKPDPDSEEGEDAPAAEAGTEPTL